MITLYPRTVDSTGEILEQRRRELESSLSALFPDKDLKVVRTITRDPLFYLVDGDNGQVTTLILDGEGSLRVRYPTGYTGAKLDHYVQAAEFLSIA